jgi:hypothetical protein
MPADTHAALEECHGRHIPAAAPGAERLDWMPPYGAVRILAWTCQRCAHVSYELGLLGGGYVIRRTDFTKVKAPVVRQTPVVRHKLAATWWNALLHGQAI